jgi:anti-sigma regulatory factor (Ser/Thr protein kinase)
MCSPFPGTSARIEQTRQVGRRDGSPEVCLNNDAEALDVLGRTLAEADGVDDVAVAALRATTSLAGVTRAGVALTMVGGRELRFLTSDDGRLGTTPAWCVIDAYDRLPLNDAVRSGSPVVLHSHDELSLGYPDLAARQDPAIAQGLVALPLRSGDQCLGGLLAYSRQPLVDPDSLRQSLAEVAGRVAHALVTVRSTDSMFGTKHLGGEGSPDPVARRLLPDDATAPATARRFVKEALEAWGADPDIVDSALLCTSEIVTNVVMHARRPSLITAQRRADQVVVRVDQPGSGPPPVIRRAPEHDDPMTVAGRGLALVDAIAARWGTESSDANVQVWFELGLTGT